jgi:hypothetical protein
MKYKQQAVTIDVNDNYSYTVHFYNTPTSCVILAAGETADTTHPGLNLTESGEWIPAPGFAQSEKQDELGVLRQKIAAMTEREESIVELVEVPDDTILYQPSADSGAMGGA